MNVLSDKKKGAHKIKMVQQGARCMKIFLYLYKETAPEEPELLHHILKSTVLIHFVMYM